MVEIDPLIKSFELATNPEIMNIYEVFMTKDENKLNTNPLNKYFRANKNTINDVIKINDEIPTVSNPNRSNNIPPTKAFINPTSVKFKKMNENAKAKTRFGVNVPNKLDKNDS